jgi:hypothetical protein
MSNANIAPKDKGWNTLILKAQYELDRYTEEYAAPNLTEAWAKCMVIINKVRTIGPSPDNLHRCQFCLKMAYHLEQHSESCVYRLAQEMTAVVENKVIP